MTTNEKYELAKWAVKEAMAKGAQEVKVNVFNSISSSVEVREKKIDRIEQANQAGLSISIMADRKFSAHSTNRLSDKAGLSRFIAGAIEGTSYLSEDENRRLPDPKLYYKGGGEDLKLCDHDYKNIDPRTKIDIALALEKEVLGADDKIISVTTSYSDNYSRGVLLTSNGFEGDAEKSHFGVYASVSLDGGESRPQASWSDSSIFFDKLRPEGIAKTALERAKRKLGQAKIESAKMSMIVENRIVRQLLGPLLSAINGSSIQQKNSFLIDSLNKKVGSDKLTLTDDPALISGMGSKHFDNEGLALSKRIIFEKGVLKSYNIDTYYGRKLDMKPTSGGITNLVLKTGKKSQEELIKTLDRGILVTGFNGGNSNGATGDFSYGIEGILIEKGKELMPVSEMNITGNMIDLWTRLEEAGNNPYRKSSWLLPSLLFNRVEFSGI